MRLNKSAPYLIIAITFLLLFQNCGSFSAVEVSQNVQLTSEDYFFVDDMILDRDDVYMKGGGSAGSMPGMSEGAGGIAIYSAQLWPNAIVPVIFDPTIQQNYRDMFLQACKEWADVTPVRCVTRTTEQSYLYVTDDNLAACNAQVGAGRTAGQRILNFGQSWCWYRQGILHEIAHVLGLMHEHQRPDRDTYVTVHPQNVQPAMAFVLDKFQTMDLGSTPYDFESITHYHAWSYAIRPAPYSSADFIKDAVIVAKPPNEAKTLTIGTYQNLSAGDITVVNRMYASQPTPTPTPLPPETIDPAVQAGVNLILMNFLEE